MAVTICFLGIFWLIPAMAHYWESSKKFISETLEKYAGIQGDLDEKTKDACNVLLRMNDRYKSQIWPWWLIGFPFFIFIIGISFGLVALLNPNLTWCTYQIVSFIAFGAIIVSMVPLIIMRGIAGVTRKITIAEEWEDLAHKCNYGKTRSMWRNSLKDIQGVFHNLNDIVKRSKLYKKYFQPIFVLVKKLRNP